ncbi:hypothetical protein [Lacihabitans soyangensis]|uniref:Uncharacterized protein n=1 Tax=Lacihabitans soyangensis TaxID=869394 RepID=A0AAE3KTA9_9BACT|nr:hypothetical protein [Lacihabitans soyangensis]MCP9763913.1 hypothetical protein [Lacihabitans soyangensis]
MMKTQIANLRSGQKGQILNQDVDYSRLPQATSHNGHAGSNHALVSDVWAKVTSENEDSMKVKLFGEIFELKANWSVSRKSVNYFCSVSKEFIEKIGIPVAKNENPWIKISLGNNIEVSNGKKYSVTICPSLVTII